jgi:hypothetical protein
MMNNPHEEPAVDEDQSTHVENLEGDRFIAVELSRRWPKYVATWSVRRRVGDSDFPLASGELERMPEGEDPPWESLRQDALAEARAAAATVAPAPQKQGFLSRLFGRR